MVQRILLFTLLIFTGIIGFSQQDSLNAFLSKGKINIQKREYTLAIQQFDKVLKLNPDNEEAIAGKVYSLYILNNIKEALDLTEFGLKKNSKNPEFYYLRGLINNNRGRYERAIIDFSQALAIDSTHRTSDVYLNRGLSKQYLPEPEAAKKDFSKSILADPQNGIAYHSRGLVNYDLGYYKDAVDDFKKSIEFNPDNAVTYYNIGMAYFKLSQKENACRYFHKSCEMKNENACKMIVLECTE
jgi:tetratricopeptide (TPR) repeat protein